MVSSSCMWMRVVPVVRREPPEPMAPGNREQLQESITPKSPRSMATVAMVFGSFGPRSFFDLGGKS